MLLVPCSSFAQIPNYVPTNGLVGWWPFNGNANDESGNGNNGTVNGSTLTADRFGNASSAFQFNGNQWIECQFNSMLNFGASSFSITCWATKEGANPFQHLVTRNEITSWPNSIASYALRYESNGLSFFSSGTPTSNNGVVVSNQIPDLNLWNNIIGVYNAQNGTISIYFNGVQVAISNINSNPQSYNNNGGIFFGVEHPTVALPSGPQFLTGKLDDIGIWNRALIACEIQDLYNAQLYSLSINAGPDQTICKGDTAVLLATGASTYLWTNNVQNGVGFIPTSTAEYVVTGTDAFGCQGVDSVLVTVNDATSSTQTQTALDAYTWPVNGQTYTQSGTYTDTLTNAAGCDSIVTLNLTLSYTGIEELNPNANKQLVKITDLNGKETPFRKNTVLLFIYDDGTVERVFEVE